MSHDKAVSRNDQAHKKPPPGINYLLVIAIDSYVHCPRLYNCVKDAMEFVQVLHQRYCFDKEHTVQIFNEAATRKNILKSFRDLQRKIQPNDNLVVYFSGHGDNVHQIGYWIPVKAEPGEEDEYINADEITARLNAINSFHTFLIVDACFSGSMFQSKNAGVPKRSDEIYRSRWGLTASHSRELALDGKAGDNSPFAECLLLKLRQNSEALSTQDLATFVKNEVRARTREQQTPIFQPLLVRGHELGQFVFHLQQDEEADWQTTQQENTIAAYSRFRRKYPNSIHYEEAKQKIKALEEEATWQKALRSNRVSGYEDYRDDYPNGVHVAEARKRIDALVSENEYKKPAPTIIIPEAPKLETRLPFEPEMVFVPGGTFKMGSNDDKSEQPIHDVTLSDFYIGKYPVTQAQWRAVMGSDPPELKFKGCDQCPVEGVSWNDIQDFLKKLNAKTGKTYRLPTEAEWEYAARGGNKSNGYKYAGSNNLDEVAWYDENSYDKGKDHPDYGTHPVGQKKANELGIYDMSGNVWEWCSDWHGAYPSTAQTNPKGPADGEYRVVRGGSWLNYDISCRVSNRYRYYTVNRYYFIGFRLAGY